MYYVYILASKRNGSIYIGRTGDLVLRVAQHKSGLVKGFTQKYGIKTLVYFEATEYNISAITRERQLKAWRRDWKKELIEKDNPQWRDLYDDLL